MLKPRSWSSIRSPAACCAGSRRDPIRAASSARGTEARRVAVVEVTRPPEPRLLRRIRPPFLAHDVGFVPGSRHVWVTSGDRGAIAIYDARSGHVLRRLPAGTPPQHVTFHGV